jgi:hypothetical protein
MNEPIIDVNVATEVERCMCGIALFRTKNNTANVFLYYTEAESTDGGQAIVIKKYFKLYKSIENPDISSTSCQPIRL